MYAGVALRLQLLSCSANAETTTADREPLKLNPGTAKRNCG